MTEATKTRATPKTLEEKIAAAEAAVVAAQQKVDDLKAAKNLNETFNDVTVGYRISYEYGRGATRGLERGKVIASLEDDGTKRLIILPDGESKTVTIRVPQIRGVL
jgi:hypothetical protein